ncbi:MAG: class I SAM-dependent methyltransferase [Gammaproteobacteria bacterium]|nr:class I SAM-dependent methyltransferase [Gammaproteobacteria bacterium]
MDNRRRYDWLAPLYDRIDLAEVAYKRKLRPRLFRGLGGTILEAGVGTGCNIAFYPPGARVVAFDASPAMLAQARCRSERLGKPVELVATSVVQTGFAEASFDAVVTAFLFGVLDAGMQGPALAELARLCKPGGEIRILDYTVSRQPFRRLWMTLWLPWERAVYGGTFSRHTERYMADAGLELAREEFLYKDMVRLLTARHAAAP